MVSNPTHITLPVTVHIVEEEDWEYDADRSPYPIQYAEFLVGNTPFVRLELTDSYIAYRLGDGGRNNPGLIEEILSQELGKLFVQIAVSYRHVTRNANMLNALGSLIGDEPPVMIPPSEESEKKVSE